MEENRTRTCLKLGLFLAFFFQGAICSVLNEENPYRHIAKLDQRENYIVEWEVDWDTKRITFNVTVRTTGYVGFGLSKRGEVDGADIVIGGVDRNGRSYFGDHHGTRGQGLERDASQDWILLDAWERGSRTFLSFSRAFETCDSEQDLPITDDLLNIIWTYGSTNNENPLNFRSRGELPVYLLDPDLVPRRLDERVPNNVQRPLLDRSTRIFNMTTTRRIQAQETTYWCSFHKTPTRSKHHIIGFKTNFPTERDRRHVHHLLVYRCHPPPGVNPATLFDTESEGGECYFIRDPNPMNTQYCTEDIHVFAVGARPSFFPEHVGIPMSASGEEYFLIQTHYDNPNVIPNLSISYSLEAYYTRNLRQYDVGMLSLGVITPGSTSIIIPPNSVDHSLVGHCAPGCTGQMLPDEGINVFASFLHTHQTGSAARYHHFRGNKELPWILTDDNYDFDYQQYRVLREERKVLPGDLLINRCTYDTTHTNGSAVVGGFSTRQEMCTAFLWYYTRSNTHVFCRSELKTDEYLDLVGVRTTRWDPNRRAMVITSPSQYRGVSMADYATNYIHWDDEMREEIQRRHIYDVHVLQCPRFTPDAVATEAQLQTEGAPAPTPSRSRGRGLTIARSRQTQGPITSSFPTNIPQYKRPTRCTRTENRAQERGREGRGWSRN
ncbi:unnamed protein product [Orchesella dallaii]|uniref:DOMON domain-containing protein n=1 Tax=Orchesella dallaii TaxID=48710 RepID=A0ABP1Q493_9HEXA